MIRSGDDVNLSAGRVAITMRPLAVTLLLLVVTASACGEADQLETQSLALVGGRTLSYPAATRGLNYTCGQSCAKFVLPPPPPFPGAKPMIKCLQWKDDCSWGIPKPAAALFTDAAQSQIFPAWEAVPNQVYHGCGPKAAQNVLAFYGYELSIEEVLKDVSTFAFWAGSSTDIATWPDSLRTGLQRLFDAKAGPGRFIVEKQSGRINGGAYSRARDEIVAGRPVIMLVRGGAHYQVATAYNSSGFFLTDYVGVDNGWSHPQTELTGGYRGLGFLGGGFGNGFEDETTITVRFVR